MRKRWALAVVFAVLAFTPELALACDTPPETVSSPDGKIALTFCLKSGTPVYSVKVESNEVVSWSALGYELKDLPGLTRFASMTSKRRQFDETWEQVWGEQRLIRNHYNELRVELTEVEPLKRQMNLVFRVFNDGLGFRYEIPEQPALRDFTINDEKTEFNFTRDHQAWWIRAFDDERYELLFKKTALSQMPTAHTPLTIEGGDLYFSIHEAALVDYASMVVDNRGGGKLKAHLVPWADGGAVRAKAPMASPWRTLQIGRSPGDLVTSYLILNLNEPNKIKDTSWIRPQKFIGIWWGMHIGRFTWGSGPIHGATTDNARKYIDYAAQLKIPALLIEGWNVGWDGDWFNNGDVFNFTQPMADFDLRAVAEYAKSRGVELIGHHETSAAIHNYERQVEDAFKLYEEVGIHTVKTGYVGKRIEHKEWHYGQLMARHHHTVALKAAAHHLMLDIHEPIKDTGLRRTYPNLMAREGARGAEWDAWGGTNGNPPEHTTILPFTSGLAGPFDYTPGIFDLLTGKTPIDRVRTTLAKQLALYLVIYSPLQMAADVPENYVNHPAFRFIQDVPVDWETTRVLDSRIGDYTTIVRRDRHSRDWYLGSVTDENARELSVALDFLEEGRSYRAEIYRDKSDTHYMSNPSAYEIVTQTVKRGDVLKLKLAAGGGQAIRFTPGQ